MTISRAVHVLAVIALTASIASGGAAPQSPPARAVTVRFVVDMRGPIAAGWFDPATESIGVRGGTSPLAWDRSLVASDADRDGNYEVFVMFASAPVGGIVAYKFKADGTDNPNGGWESGPNRPLVVRSPRVEVRREFDGAPIAFPRTVTGDLRLHAAFPSAFVAPRDVRVFLPAGYEHDRARRYPVLYMHDGQNLFDAATGFGAEWRVDETAASLLRARRVEPTIVVGVSSLPETRIDDYTPVPNQFERGGQKVPLGGKADLYGRFLVQELKPFVDRAYRTRPGAADTALGGSSLGGLVSMYLGLRYPEVFSKLLVVSPSVWWADNYIVGAVEAAPAKPATRIWLDIGTAEGDEAVTGARRLRDTLVAKGWRLGDDLLYVEAPNARHDESAWAARLGRMLEFIFPRHPSQGGSPQRHSRSAVGMNGRNLRLFAAK